VQRHPFNLDGLLHLVARRSLDRGDDGQFDTGQGIQQRAFARIRLAGNHDLDAFAQQRALARMPQHGRQLLLQP